MSRKPRFYVSPYPTTVQHSDGSRREQARILLGMAWGSFTLLLKYLLYLALILAVVFGFAVALGYFLALGGRLAQ